MNETESTSSQPPDYSTDGCALALMFTMGVGGWLLGLAMPFVLNLAFNPLQRSDPVAEWLTFAQVLFVVTGLQCLCLSFCVWLVLQIDEGGGVVARRRLQARALLQACCMWPLFVLAHFAFYSLSLFGF